MQTISRRTIFWALLLLVPILGLGTRAFAARLPHFWATYAPDALWALLVLVLVVLVAPRLRAWKAALVALSLAYLIELSQLYQAPWINAIRATRLGGLILGFGFLWSDIICYTIGISIGFLIALWVQRKA